jgi:ATP:corrinoid adenosyltransferase
MTFQMPQVTSGEAEWIAEAIQVIAWRCHARALHLAEMAVEYARDQRTICEADGCLVLLDEVCPACRVRRLAREQRLLEAA